MDVTFTTHPSDGPGKYYMVVAEAGEWEDVIRFIESNPFWPTTTKALDLVLGLNSWGIEGD